MRWALALSGEGGESHHAEEDRGGLQDAGVVVDEQDRGAGLGGARGAGLGRGGLGQLGGLFRGRLLGGGHPDGEDGAVGLGGAVRDAAAHRVGHRGGLAEADAVAGRLGGAGAAEDGGGDVGRDAGAVVDHLDRDAVAPGGRGRGGADEALGRGAEVARDASAPLARDDADADAGAAVFGEGLGGVLDEVADEAEEGGGVGESVGRGRVGDGLDLEEGALADEGREEVAVHREERVQVDGLRGGAGGRRLLLLAGGVAFLFAGGGVAGRGLAGRVHDRAGEAGGLLGGEDDGLEAGPGEGRVLLRERTGKAGLGRLGGVDDRQEEVVEVVRQRGRVVGAGGGHRMPTWRRRGPRARRRARGRRRKSCGRASRGRPGGSWRPSPCRRRSRP